MSKPRHEKPGELRELPQQQYSNPSPQQTVETDPDVIPNKFGKYLIYYFRIIYKLFKLCSNYLFKLLSFFIFNYFSTKNIL